MDRQRRVQETRSQLLLRLSQENCLSSVELQNERRRDSSMPRPIYLEIPILYLTERGRSGNSDVKTFYSAARRQAGIEAGSVSVVFASKLSFEPSLHEMPNAWRDAEPLERDVDFRVQTLKPLDGMSDVKASPLPQHQRLSGS
jgi:hypothetical protein